MNDLRITLIQTALQWEDVDANLAMFSEKISLLKEDTDVIILPEMFSTGFSMNASTIAETMTGKSMQWMRKTAAERNCVITGSIAIKVSNETPAATTNSELPATNYYNRLIWMQPDGIFFHYDKRHLFALGHEDKNYTAGKKKLIVEWKGWKIHPLICYDLRFPVWSRRTKAQDYDLLLYVANWPEKRVQAWSQLLIGRAIENQSYVAGVNRVGDDGNGMYHSGESAAVNFKGEVINNSCPHETCVDTVTLKKNELTEWRTQLPFLEDADEFEISA